MTEHKHAQEHSTSSILIFPVILRLTFRDDDLEPFGDESYKDYYCRCAVIEKTKYTCNEEML